jgi:glycosyltransferase involved in cell wall biosynthesis
MRQRLAFIVSHPVQYYTPLYQRLSARGDMDVKVFFTWHDGAKAIHDMGFGQSVAWDIPVRDGYEFELVENISSDPGTHHFFGLRNPALVDRVMDWQPTGVHVTGWAWSSHLSAMRAFRNHSIPTLFRGDSHLLDSRSSDLRWWAKKILLTQIYRWPNAFLVTGKANEAYYRTFGVGAEKLVPCPHSIDCSRFAQPDAEYEDEARRWRSDLGIGEDKVVLLFAGKFEPRKDPVGFMKSVAHLNDDKVVAIVLGGGELQPEIDALAAARPGLFRVLPFQNQSRMPIVYRLGDLFVMPSVRGETWGLAVNEALASNRPVLVSDKVGCAEDVVDGNCAHVFGANSPDGLLKAIRDLSQDKDVLAKMRAAAALKARHFDISRTASTLIDALRNVSKRRGLS